MKMTVDRKILAGVVFCSCILLTVAFISFYNSEKFKETNQWVNHTHEVLFQFEQILVYCIDAETGERGYIITGAESYLEPYNRSSAQIVEHLNKVKDLTKDNPFQQKNILGISRQITLLTERLSTTIEVRRTAGFEKAQQMVVSGIAKRELDQIREEIEHAKKIEETLLVERKQKSEQDAQKFNIISITLVIAIVIVLISVYVIITANLRALRQAQTDAMNKNLILEGTSGLIKEMQGNKQIKELTQTIINFLVTYTKAQIGALYLAEEAKLIMISAYAFHKNKEDLPVIGFGEGLAGQAAAEKRTILCNNIPSGHFNINSSFGEVVPENIIVLPVIFEGRVAGVVELGSIYNFTAIQQQFLSIMADSIAIAITSSQSREKTKELLEETQRQAEELEAQQEALKQSNEELHSKTELLERSEVELRAQQEELQQSNEELEEKASLLETQKEMLKIANREVESKAKELELTGQYKSEFLANMSHELRTPLNSILILAQLLAEDKNKLLGEKEKKYAQSIYSSGTDLLNLINEVLDLSKVEAGKIDLEIGDVYVSSVMSNIHATFSEVAKNKGVVFEIIYNAEHYKHPLLTDKQRLGQILRNLLSNAFKFTSHSGKVILKVDLIPAGESGYLNERDEVIAFSVSDTGIGIPRNKQEIIFQAFHQADGSTKRKYGGTGLGLSISRKIAHALGGEISLQSEEGKGSTFTLYLPLKLDPSKIISGNSEIELKQPAIKSEITRQASEAITAFTENAIDDRNTINENDKVVLIIEDDVNFAKILLDFVRQKHYKGVIAHQGNTGLSFARYYKPEAIILDMKLPEMDGAAVLKQLKNDPGLRHIPVQIISGYDRKKEGMELGAFDFIKKPVTHTDIQDVFDRMEEFIRKKLKKLLIVEDNREQNEAIRILIGNGDVKSLSAYGGVEAYEMIQKEKFDCIIIDLGLPDMSGFELLEKIKANSVLDKIPVIVYTGKDLNKEEVARLNKLANTVVLKTANSIERLLDETVLFLHRVESELPKEKQQIIRKLHRSDEVLKNRKVLIVDDDIRNIYSLTNALEEEKLECIIADNGKEAIKKLQKHEDVDIVLMDLMMPEMDGFEATMQIRAIDKFSKLPIIALTAKAMKGDREKCLAAGMSDYIAKPVNIEQLLSLMRVWLYK